MKNTIYILTISEFIFDDSYEDVMNLKLIKLEDLNIKQEGWTFAYSDSTEKSNTPLTLFSNLTVPSSKNKSFLYYDTKEQARSTMSKLRELTISIRQSKTREL